MTLKAHIRTVLCRITDKYGAVSPPPICVILQTVNSNSVFEVYDGTRINSRF